jgi:hypothetical protein
MKYPNPNIHLNLKGHATKSGNTPRRSMHLILVSVLALLMLGTSTVILAESPPDSPPSLPDKSTCDEFSDVYARLECRQKALAKQLTYTSDTVFADNTKMHGYVKPARLKSIRNAKSKANRAVEKNDAKVLKRLAKSESRGHKDQDLGHLVPLGEFDDDDDDDICDYEQDNPNAQCAAIELLNGEDLQVCNPEKKNKGKGKGKDKGGKLDGLECDRWFDSDEGTNETERADMEVIAMNLDESFIAMEDNLLEMNQRLKDVNDNPNPPVEPARVFMGQQGENGGCVIPLINQHLANSVIALRVIHAAAEGLGALTDDSCDQSVVVLGTGGNTSLVCTIFSAATSVANLAYIAVDEADKVQNGNVQAALVKCVQQTGDSIDEVKTAIYDLQKQLKDYVEITIHKEHEAIKDNDNLNTTTIVDNDDENTTEIIQVLNTPHGQREKSWKP